MGNILRCRWRGWPGNGGEGRKAGREQKLEGHVRLLGVPSNIVCESPSVEFRLIKCSTLFVAFVLLAAILSFEPFLFKSVLFVAAGSRKLRTLSRPRRVFPAFLFYPPLHQSWCVFFPPDFPRFREVFSIKFTFIPFCNNSIFSLDEISSNVSRSLTLSILSFSHIFLKFLKDFILFFDMFNSSCEIFYLSLAKDGFF